jgi:hypothetical protein
MGRRGGGASGAGGAARAAGEGRGGSGVRGPRRARLGEDQRGAGGDRCSLWRRLLGAEENGDAGDGGPRHGGGVTVAARATWLRAGWIGEGRRHGLKYLRGTLVPGGGTHRTFSPGWYHGPGLKVTFSVTNRD